MAGPYGATLDWSPDTFRQLVETNILGTYYGSRAAMKYFVQQHQGKLINILGAGWNETDRFPKYVLVLESMDPLVYEITGE